MPRLSQVDDAVMKRIANRLSVRDRVRLQTASRGLRRTMTRTGSRVGPSDWYPRVTPSKQLVDAVKYRLTFLDAILKRVRSYPREKLVKLMAFIERLARRMQIEIETMSFLDEDFEIDIPCDDDISIHIDLREDTDAYVTGFGFLRSRHVFKVRVDGPYSSLENDEGNPDLGSYNARFLHVTDRFANNSRDSIAQAILPAVVMHKILGSSFGYVFLADYAPPPSIRNALKKNGVPVLS